MKIVLNKDYGGFTFPEEVCEEMGIGDWLDEPRKRDRVHPVLIEWVEEHKYSTDLEVVTISDRVSDWDVIEFDGLETLIFVLDGKIYYA